MSKSFAVSPLTMPTALLTADVALGERQLWAGSPSSSQAQLEWLATWRQRATVAAMVPEIRYHATNVPAEHAAWLAENGWEARVQTGAPGDLFLGGLLEVAVKWLQPGMAHETPDGTARAMLKAGVTMVEPVNGHRIADVATRGSRYAFLFQQAAAAPVDAADLIRRARDIQDARDALPARQAYLDVPMVDLRSTRDAEEVIGIRSGAHAVTQASEQFSLEIDELGGSARAVAEAAVSRGGGGILPTVRIEEPFVVVVRLTDGQRTGGLDVAFAAYVDRDSWRRPRRAQR